MGDFFGTILFPIRWVIEAILVGWHWVWTTLGLPGNGGLSWVLSVLGVVVVVRLAIFPLFVKQINSQRKMMELGPQMKKVQEKYRGKKDQLSREAQMRETQALYKKHGTSPVSGCLPMLVQMPIFLSLFWTLRDIATWHAEGRGGLNKWLFTPEKVNEFEDAMLFDIAPLSKTLVDHFQHPIATSTAAIVMMIILVGLMIATQFTTQLQIVSKNLSPEARQGQAYQMQRIMLYVIPFAMIFSGVFFPLGVVTYWFFNNLWTMAQQFYIIRENPTPGSEAAKAREERVAKKGKRINAKGKIVSIEEYEREQAELERQVELERRAKAKRVQPKSAKRAKKDAQVAAEQKKKDPAGPAGPAKSSPDPAPGADKPANGEGKTT
ncbi:MAG: membrane protein insertase YidC [Microbacterium gubbeenense]|uniref:membrane protein insertase YidC n=1 Tax=Microbacterium gubbeenense TaxID=159896 RepID=UPI00041CD73D|nr:membrane protein insertase YidC [Microbacterium gubbeenense]